MRLTVVLALLGLSNYGSAKDHINYSNCTLDTTVPLDYQNPELGEAVIPLVKYPAEAQSSSGAYQGMILLNPGGPGHSGVEMVLSYGSTLQAAIGNNFDYVGFDPRGIHNSQPVANCTSTPSSPGNNYKARTIPRVSDEYYQSWIDYGIDLGRNCQHEVGGPLGAGTHMSTATTARDMLSIVDAFAMTHEGKIAAKPANLLNYYGVSYGTFLGQTVASMFPDRVGHVVLDGVVSPEGYVANYTWSSVTHLDGVISTFFIHCSQVGPGDCSFHTGSTPKDIQRRFDNTMAQLEARGAAENNWSNATEIDSALLLLKIGLLSLANYPADNFKVLPDVLVSLETALANKNLGAWIDSAHQLYGDPGVDGSENYQYISGVLCSDMQNRWFGKTLEDLRPLLQYLEAQSIVGDIWIQSMLGCLGWSIQATETFQGPFGGDTANPILFVGNTFDPVTPYENALAGSSKFKNAQALIVDGLGHGTSATQNLCALSKIAAYFQTGLPPTNDDAHCPFEQAGLGLTLNGTLEETIRFYGLL
ncbi:unnamed protein product [Clonostachys solani]|uniref:Uncharacterized protein n=1 Tax=Clonostachys solani TaxID=160281 RepID=A0A9N9ZK58_9HYPO|nr:unnamed protein product [Clonostachys solani]